MTLVYGTADRLEQFAGRNHSLLRFLHRYRDPVIGKEYWRLYGPADIADSGDASPSLETQLSAAKQYLSALENAVRVAREKP